MSIYLGTCHYYSGFEYQPSVKLGFYPSQNQTLWASISRAVRTPSKVDLEAAFPDSNSSAVNKYKYIILGNENFESEELMAYEIGYRIKPNQKSLIDISAFYNDYDNLQTRETDSSGSADAYALVIVDNKGSAKSYGFELSTKYNVNRNWKLEANYSFITIETNTDITSNDAILKLNEETEPKNQYRITSKLNITPNIEFDNSLYYVDDLNGDINEYYRFDSRLSYRPTVNLEFSLIGQNLLDQHQEYSKSLYSQEIEVPRSYYFKTSYKF